MKLPDLTRGIQLADFGADPPEWAEMFCRRFNAVSSGLTDLAANINFADNFAFKPITVEVDHGVKTSFSAQGPTGGVLILGSTGADGSTKMVQNWGIWASSKLGQINAIFYFQDTTATRVKVTLLPVKEGYVGGNAPSTPVLPTDCIPKSIGTAAGDMLYATAAGVWARLPIGSSTQVLTVSGGLPTWAATGGGGGGGGLTVTNITTSGAVSALGADQILNVTTLSADLTLTLPAAASAGSVRYTIKDSTGKAGGAQLLLIATSGTDTIDGGTKRIYLTDDYGQVTLVSDGTSNWIVVETQAGAWAPDPRAASIAPLVWVDANRKLVAVPSRFVSRSVVTTWTDLVSGNVFTTSGSNLPSLESVGGPGSRFAVLMAPAGSVFLGGSSVTNNSGAATVIAVLGPPPGNGWNASGPRSWFGHGVAAGAGTYAARTSLQLELRGNGTGASPTIAVPPGASDQGSRSIGFSVVSTRIAAANSTFKFNGVTQTTTVVNAAVGNISAAPIICGISSTGIPSTDELWDGVISEVIYFAGALPDAELLFYEKRLMKKWGL